MRIIEDIYKEYNVMHFLTLHQLRVAAVASIICDSLSINIDKDSIIKACLLHDIANIIKFNLNYFPEENEPEGLEYWEDVKYNLILKYGNDEHEASVKITKELGMNDYIIQMVNCIDAASIETIKMDNDFGQKICMYADNRVTPHKIVSIEERNEEARKRYKNHPHSFTKEERDFFMENLREIENQIFSKSNINPEDLNDENVNKVAETLKSYQI